MLVPSRAGVGVTSGSAQQTDGGADPFRAWFAALPPVERRALARAYAEDARARGAFVVRPDGSEVAIPPLLSPVTVAPEAMRRVCDDAHAITAGLVRLTAALMQDPARAPLRQRLFGSFTPLEAEGLARTWRSAASLATARVDFLVDTAGQHRALEVNTTIPAMQGYSDCIAEAFLRAVARARGLPTAVADRLVDDNGRNTDDLLASLLAHQELRGGPPVRAIAIVARPGDAQRGELEHYARRWSAAGIAVRLATPAEVRADGDRARIADFVPDLIYRHVFARRLDPRSEFARMCLEPERFRVLNPIASHLEVKGMLALLSAAEGDDGVGLTDEERAAVARTVPWTRLVERGPARDPDGERLADLAHFVAGEGARLVLKRSWDYGGRSVFLGAEIESESAQARLRALVGREGAVGWSELVDFALADSEAWVVQELVAAQPQPHLRITDGEVESASLYVDLSAYTNAGVAVRPSGGAVRASASRIVNILGGGGLAPLLKPDVVAELLSASPS
jgi:hypothetical protein